MKSRACWVIVGLLILIGVPSLEAQDTDPQEAVIGLETYQVVGSRVAGRSAQDSPVPVDIIRGEDLQTYGIRDMDSLLSATVPSYNVNQQPISDAATLVRPANLRGLSSDSTLVLVNGKRRHRASVITFLGGGVSDGSHAPDISVIPSIALEQVEVLRDGAAAQYGSDAIAGILNFKLREDRHGLSIHTSWGQTYHGDGDKVNIAANLGRLDVTIDYYRIKVQDRLGQTSPLRLTQPDIATLMAQGVSDAASYSFVTFFSNDFDTTTQGVDVVATYPLETLAGDTRLTLVGNWNDTEVDSFTPGITNANKRRLLEGNLPEFRFSLMADHLWGPWRLLTRLHYYDNFFEDHVASNLPLRAGERWLVDLELSYTLRQLPFLGAATIAFGAENLFDTYPRRNPYARIVGAKYPESSPYGFNGGFYYVRAGFEL